MCIASCRASSSTAAVEVDEDADLVRRRMDVRGDRAAGVEARGSGDDDVLAELADQLQPLLVEGGGRIGAVRVDGAQHLLGERLELVVLRDGLGLAADADDRADAALDDRADEALGRRPVGALAGLRHALLAQQASAASRSPSVSWSARLHSIIPAPVGRGAP